MEESVRVFKSFEDAEAADLERRRRLTPEERMAIFSRYERGRFRVHLSKDLKEFVA